MTRGSHALSCAAQTRIATIGIMSFLTLARGLCLCLVASISWSQTYGSGTASSVSSFNPATSPRQGNLGGTAPARGRHLTVSNEQYGKNDPSYLQPRAPTGPPGPPYLQSSDGT